MPTTEPTPIPSTPTGRYVLEEWENEGGPDPEMARAIAAIEAEARALSAEPTAPPALDVERLARLLWEAVEKHVDPDAGTLAFDEHDWQSLLIEEERDEYRAMAARLAAEPDGEGT